MSDKSAALFRASNLLALDYPFAAALASALAICDEAVVVVGQSEDGTLPWVRDLAGDYPGRVIVQETTFRFDWGWQERWWNLASRLTDAEWLLWLDADEVIDPALAPALWKQMDDDLVRLIRFPFIHLYATGAYQIHFSLTHNTRLGRRSAGYRMVNRRSEARPNGPACAVTFGDEEHYRNAHADGWPGQVTMESEPIRITGRRAVPVLHYGWCRDAKALAMSQRKQSAWYADGDGLQDGRLPDVAPYDFNLARMLDVGRAKPFAREHPDVMQPWLDAHEAQWSQIQEAVACPA